MPIYKKTIRTGKFAKAGEDFREGDRVTILDEGVEVEGQFRPQVVFKVRVPSGSDLTMPLNGTSLNNMIDAFGEDSKNWVGKEVKVWRILQNVQGKMLKVTYLSHPDADIDEQGNFFITGKQAETPTRKIPGTNVDYPDDGINPDDIGF